MLMAGAAGRNLGKTEFLCEAIRSQSKHRPVIGIKITAFDDEDGNIRDDLLKTQTYRTLDGEFMVTREEPAEDNKDTHRMFRAGAAQVYWLRSLRTHMQEGIEALLERMQGDGIDVESACLVCESAGARNFIEPGLFFVIRQHTDDLKPSAYQVADLADRLVTFSSQGWDLDPHTLVFGNGRWGVEEDAAAVVLAGGASRRMGEDKSLMWVGGVPLIEKVVEQLQPNFKQVLISGSREKFGFIGVPVVEDREPGEGPLMGLLSVLVESEHELNFVTACDVPDVQMPFVRRMLEQADGFDAVVPVVNGDKQPLFAVYRKSAAGMIDDLLSAGKKSMHALLDELNVRYVDLPGEWYHNLNNREDVERYNGETDD